VLLRFATQKGNSNEDGSREGDHIVEIKRPRHAGELYVFVYWWEAPTAKRLA